MNRSSARRGFTLIELLLVIGIIAILASIVIVAVNPNKQLGDARNAQRRADVNAILNAVYQSYIDKGSMPFAGVSMTDMTSPTDYTHTYEICYANNQSHCLATLVTLQGLTGSYLVSFPRDPKINPTTEYTSATSGLPGHIQSGSYYYIGKTSSNRVTVTASGTEVNGSVTGKAAGSAFITVTR